MRASLFTTGALAAALFAGATNATPIPDGGLTRAEVASWLQTQGYASEAVADNDGTQHLRFTYQDVRVGVYMFDCSGDRCGSLQFSVGWATHGKFDTSQMNRWNRDKRWCRGYFDAENDPWVERDVDLSPGGSYDMLKDELFDVFKNCIINFKAMYNL
jgi:hypothetical protein